MRGLVGLLALAGAAVAAPFTMAPLPVERYPQAGPLAMAVYLTRPQAQGFAAAQAASTMGLPVVVTRDLTTAMQHPFIVSNGPLRELTPDQWKDLRLWIQAGGTLVIDDLSTPEGLDLMGGTRAVASATRQHFDLQGPDGTPQPLPVGGHQTIGLVGSLQAKILSRFDDGSAAVVDHTYDWGHVIGIGVALDDLLPVNRDALQWNLRTWYTQYTWGAAWLDPAPSALSGNLVITHNLSSWPRMQPLLTLEQAHGMSATWFARGTGSDLALVHRLQQAGADLAIHAPTLEEGAIARRWLAGKLPGLSVETFSGAAGDNPLRISSLEAAGYKNDATFPDIGWFPELAMENGGGERESAILQFARHPDGSVEALDRAAPWHGTEVVSLSPDEDGTLETEKALLARADRRYSTMALRDLSAWWRIRSRAHLSLSPRGGSWIVHLTSPVLIYGLTIDFTEPRQLLPGSEAVQFDATRVVVPMLRANHEVQFTVQAVSPKT